MQLKWKVRGGDAEAPGGSAKNPTTYEIERAGATSFWAFMNGKPVGMFPSMEEAQERCQRIQDTGQIHGPPVHPYVWEALARKLAKEAVKMAEADFVKIGWKTASSRLNQAFLLGVLGGVSLSMFVASVARLFGLFMGD